MNRPSDKYSYSKTIRSFSTVCTIRSTPYFSRFSTVHAHNVEQKKTKTNRRTLVVCCETPHPPTPPFLVSIGYYLDLHLALQRVNCADVSLRRLTMWYGATEFRKTSSCDALIRVGSVMTIHFTPCAWCHYYDSKRSMPLVSQCSTQVFFLMQQCSAR